MRPAIHPILPWPVVAIAAVLLVALSVWVYRAVFAGREGRWRWLAEGLRLAAILMAVLAMFRPSLVFTETRKQSATLLVLVDHSRSMLVEDDVNGQSRWRALGQTLLQSEAGFEQLGKLLKLRRFWFDDKIREPGKLTDPPTGNRTAIGDVVRDAVPKGDERVAAMILLSDGTSTFGSVPPAAAARALKDLGIPLYAVGFGKQAAGEAGRDLAFRTITAGPTVFEKNRLTVTGELDVRGFAGQSLNARLLFDNTVVASRTVQAPQADGRIKVSLDYVPTVSGEHKVTLDVQPADSSRGELVRSNNEISTFVTVLKGGLRVLYADGNPTWEQKFIRWSLDKAPDIALHYIAPPGPLPDQSPAFDGPLFDRRHYDVFVLRDVPANWLPAAALKRLKQSVEEGAGFAMLGGLRSFGPGGYDRTPVADALPVMMHQGDPQIDKSLPMLPTAQGLAHFIVRLGDEKDTESAWRSLDPLAGASTFTDVKPTGRVLARSPDDMPLLVGADVGQGRAIAFAGDTTWQWHLQSESSLRLHRRFWRQVILWLAKKEQAGSSRLWLDLSRRRVQTGEGLELTAGAEDESGRPVGDAEFEVVVTGPDGRENPLRLYQQGETARGTYWATDKPGDYVVTLNGKQIESPVQHRFLVFEEDLELTTPAADLPVLRQMTEITGGEYVQPEQLPRFLEDLSKKDLRLEVERLRHLRLWDNWPFLLAFVALLTAEWALRKWKGLV